MPQLLLDGLSPEDHIEESLQTCMRLVTLPPYGSLAPQSQPRDPQECNASRFVVTRAPGELQETARHEDVVFPQRANVLLRRALRERRLAFMRELNFLTGAPDLVFIADFVLDMDKLGWTTQARVSAA